MPPLRLLIVADDLLVRSGLASVLHALPDIRVVGVTTTTNLALDLPIFQPDLLLWDYHGGDRLESALPLVVLVADERVAVRALSLLQAAPRFGLLLRDSATVMLQTALHAVADGLTVITPTLARLLLPATALPAEEVQLTPREIEVLHGMAQGLTNKAIAHRLGITDHTVKFHVNAIMTKLNAQSRTDAVVRATRAGLVVL